MEIKANEIELVSVNSLIPHPKNMNHHSAEQIERLCKVIDYQGFRNPLIVQKGTNLIVAGHGRILAARKLGIEKVPVTYQEFESEDQLYACIVSDNAIASWAELDLSMVNSELENLGPIDIDLLGIKDFVVESIEKFEPQSDEDEVPELKDDHITKRGDIWLLGKHRVMCGDSTMIDDVEKLMRGEKADMVFTDPPYGMNLKTDYARTDRVKGNTYKPVLNDDEKFDPTDFLNYFYDVKEQFWWGADYYCSKIPESGAWEVWDKKIESLDESMGTGFELCWSKQPHKRRVARILWSGFTAKERNEKRCHPTQKPIELCEKFFRWWGSMGDLVIDLFLGSGTTLIACEKTNRKCYGMELDEHYCDVIINRWQNYTNQKATLESTGQTYDELKNDR